MSTCLFGSGIVGRTGQILLYCCPSSIRVSSQAALEKHSLDCP